MVFPVHTPESWAEQWNTPFYGLEFVIMGQWYGWSNDGPPPPELKLLWQNTNIFVHLSLYLPRRVTNNII